VLCGKAKCKRLHGPYWYAYWQVGRGTRKVYVGKSLPADLAERRLRARSRRRCRGHDLMAASVGDCPMGRVGDVELGVKVRALAYLRVPS
jgi:hypothetical protein